MENREFSDLQQLVEAALEGRISPEDQQRLEQMVLNSAEGRQFYVQYMHQHAALHWSAAEPVLPPQAHQLAAARAAAGDEWDEPAAPIAGASGETWVTRLRGKTRWRWLAVLATAAAAVVAAAWLNVKPAPDVALAPAGNGATSEQQPIEPIDNTVALLVSAPSAVWDASEPVPRAGAPLAPGRLLLKSGFAHLEFYSGATVVLEGPADFQLISRNEAYCARGKLRATVPAHATGFTIGTPKLDLVDLGTEFGLQIDDGQKTEVHVFSGKVEVYDAGVDRADSPRKELTTGQGLRLEDPQATAPIEVASALESNTAAFRTARQLAVQSRETTRLRHQQWLAASNDLRSDESLLVYFPFEGDDPFDRSLMDRATAGGVRHDATIVGSTWATGRWPGKQGLEFRRLSDRVRLHIPGEFDSLTMAAWVRVDGLPNLNNALLMAEGWEPGELHWQIGEGGKLVLGVQSDPKGRGGNYHAFNVFTPERFGQWTHLAVAYDRENSQVTHYVDGKPAARESVLFHIPLRLGDVEIGNWNVATHRNNNPVRYFNGCMDEFMFFSRALDDEEIDDLFIEGQPRL